MERGGEGRGPVELAAEGESGGLEGSPHVNQCLGRHGSGHKNPPYGVLGELATRGEGRRGEGPAGLATYDLKI